MKERTPEIKEFIRKHSDLFWYIPQNKKEDISDETLVEFILNYGDMHAVIELMNLFGVEKTKNIFENTLQISPRRAANYNELTINFFQHYFRRHAHHDIR
ncbi:MAG: hypothetical protein PHO94_05735 [Petrimonas sp.]|nr:hypothetical protein [Petrimonas sp.]